MPGRVLMVGRTRYRLPLSPPLRRKFDALDERLDVHVLASAATDADAATAAAETFELLPPSGRECRLRVVTVVREDEISLYGFGTADEEELFRLLQNVSGLGPKLALKILSGLSAPALQRALATGDHATLVSAP